MTRALIVLLLAGCPAPAVDERGPGPITRPGGCPVGATEVCQCAGGTGGTRTCVTPEGLWTACGCAAPGGPRVAVVPEPPAPQVCGGSACASFTEEDTEVGAKACCTTSGGCGSKSAFLFGAACVARGGPVGAPAPECPDESINFVDLRGCCRPDGACGLSIDDVPNFDLGCVERSAMERLMNDGAADRNLLSAVFFIPVKPASFPARQCVFRP